MNDSSLTSEVRSFFHRYNEAFLSFDGRKVAAFYYEPTVTMRGDGSVHFLQSHDELASFFQGVIDIYRKDGYADSNLSNFDVQPIGSLSALVAMDWAMLRRNGSAIRRWRQSYNLVRSEGDWRILVSTFHVSIAAA